MTVARSSAMTFTDLLIIYLAFGSPLMVYQFLRNRDDDAPRRILISLLTLVCWIPIAARLGYRYLSNAYFDADFVSARSLDAINRELAEIRELMKPELVAARDGSSAKDLFETVDRYIALTVASQEAIGGKFEKTVELFAGGGRDRELASRCMARRNRRRLERHHIRTQLDLVNQFGRLLENYSAAVPVLGSVITIARELGDSGTVDLLEAVEANSGKLWMPEEHSILEGGHVTISKLTIKTSPLNVD